MIGTGEDAMFDQMAIGDMYDAVLSLLAASRWMDGGLVVVAGRVRSRGCTGVFASARLVGMPFWQAFSYAWVPHCIRVVISTSNRVSPAS